QRGGDLTNIDRVEQLDKDRRRLIAEVEELKSKRNDVSQQIAVLKREKKDAEPLIAQMREVGDRIKRMDEQIR
ncbi:serine--tRNA ligase, partial [Anoxybacillus sp. LAT_11]|nr:serine--tRNA ligase [Anoxybacillus sp. LAT_11]